MGVLTRYSNHLGAGRSLFKVDLQFLLEIQVLLGDAAEKWIFRLHSAPQPFAEIKIPEFLLIFPSVAASALLVILAITTLLIFLLDAWLLCHVL